MAYLGRLRAIEPCPPNLWRMATVGSESDASCRLEYREDVFRNNLAQAPSLRTWGFLLDHLTGFPGLPPGWGDVQGWAGRAVTLPEGWAAIEIERIWIGGRPYTSSHAKERNEPK